MATLTSIPIEIQLEMLSAMDTGDKINLAVADPAHFLSDSLHIFNLEARARLELEERRRRTPFTEDPDDWPILQVAIRDDHDLDTIKQILDAFFHAALRGVPEEAERPRIVDGDFGGGGAPSTCPPPIHVAASRGRSDIITYLLEQGANPRLKHSRIYQPHGTETLRGDIVAIDVGCHRSGAVHEACLVSGGEELPTDVWETACCNAFELAMRGAAVAVRAGHETTKRRCQEAALTLSAQGGMLPDLREGEVADRLAWLAVADLGSLIRTLLEPVLALDEFDDFRWVVREGLAEALHEIVVYGPNGGVGEAIHAMVSTGNRLGIWEYLPLEVILRRAVEEGNVVNAAALRSAEHGVSL
ncbi:hypothetical protein F4778DRAFT_758141 [Xylariomycetidae sp. FL2044]|nr:hypothetical protein F4778DRAFT_758141 [Xylariomycetidae sp. FL2044]